MNEKLFNKNKFNKISVGTKIEHLSWSMSHKSINSLSDSAFMSSKLVK